MWVYSVRVWCCVLGVVAASVPCWGGVPAEGRILQPGRADEQWQDQRQGEWQYQQQDQWQNKGRDQWQDQRQDQWQDQRPWDKDLSSKNDGGHQQWQEGQQPMTTENIIGQMLREQRLREPLAVLIDTAPESLRLAQKLWAAVLAMNHNIKITLLLIPFNSTESYDAVMHLQADTFLQALNALEPSMEDHKGGVGFQKIVKATFMVPFDSAVLLFTGRPAKDETVAQLATVSLIKKRCKLYVWWSGQQEDDTIYKDVAKHSGGNFIRVPTDTTEWGDLPWQSSLDTMVTLAVRRGATGRLSIPLHLDNTVSSIRVTVVGKLDAVVLYDIGGSPINLQSQESLRLYHLGAVALSQQPEVLDVQLNTTDALPGIWRLTTTGSRRRYDVTVKANSNLGVSAVNFNGTHADLMISLQGDIGRIQTVSAVDENGTKVHELQYKQPELKELVVQSTNVPQKPFYLYLEGEDNQGAPFTRMSYVNYQHVDRGQAIILRIRPDTQLEVMPGRLHTLRFDVINNASRTIQVALGCRSTQIGVRCIRVPPIIILIAGQIETISIELQTNNNAVIGTMDTITLTADAGIDSVTTSVIIYVQKAIRDTNRPTINTIFHNDCKDADEWSNCHRRVWNIQTTIQDPSGLMDITSTPMGLKFQTPFIIGSKLPTTIQYSASCCNPKLEIKATDLYNNTITSYINVYKQNESSSLSAGEIAAIVVGVIAILILIIVIVLTIVFCKNKQKMTIQQHQTPR